MALAPGTRPDAVAAPPQKKPKPAPAPAPASAPRGDHAASAVPAPVRPDDRAGPRPAAPVAAQPNLGGAAFTGPPVPVLAQLGYFGSIQDANRRLEIVHNAWTSKFNSFPPPGVALDLVRSNVQDEHLPGLVQAVPGSMALARTQGILVQHKNNDPSDFLVTRPDGVMVQNNPLLRKIEAAVEPLKPSEQYPNVQMGMLPVGDMEGLFNSIERLDKWAADGTVTVTDHGVTIPALEKQLRTAEQAPDPNAPPASYATPSNFGSMSNLQRDKLESARQAVQTVKDAQGELNKEMGTKLPVSGFFNQTWVSALSNWMKSGSYFRSVTKYQAAHAGYGDNVAAYLNAWKAKQHAVREHGLFSHFLQAMPLQLFGHGLRGVPAAAASYITAGKSPLDPAFYSPTVALHGLTRSAGLTLDTVGGTVTQAKADAAAGNEFAKTIAPVLGEGKTFEEAKAHARHVLQQNPSWMRVFFPDMPDHPEGITAVIDQVTNVAGDLILLRKATFTGERVAAGDVVQSAKSPYVNSAASFAYEELRRGNIGRAASMLEGGQGAERLVANAAKAVKRGTMNQETFTRHVAELYATGQTTVEVGKRATETAARKGTGPFAKTTDEQLQARVDALDARYNGLVDKLAGSEKLDVTSARSMQSYINRNAKKVARKGLPPVPTIADQTRSFAEGKLLDFLTKHPEEPLVQLLNRELDEAFAIRKELELRGDARGGIFGHDPIVDGPQAPPEPVLVTVSGPALGSLRTGSLPSPGVPGRAWLTAKNGLRSYLDRFDATMRNGSGSFGNAAASLVSNVRTLVAHEAGRGSRGYFDPGLPESVFNYVLKETGDATLANKLESNLVRFRGTENVRGIQQIQQKLEQLHEAKYPAGRGGVPSEPFAATLATEAPSVFRFPAGGERELNNALDVLAQSARNTTNGLNRLARLHARIILSGFPIPGGGTSLFWKHAIGDTVRRIVGGGFSMATPSMRAAKREIDTLAAADPAVERALGTFLARTKAGETRWLLNRGANAEAVSFRTGDHFGKANYMTAAGAKVRALLTDEALHAYQASTAGDLSSLVRLVLQNNVYRRLWKSARQKARAAGEDLSADEYAALIYKRFQDFEDGASAAGVSDPFNAAGQVLRAHRGASADAALGKWIGDNKIDLPVRSGLVEKIGTFDYWTGKWVGQVIMAPNKWNRGRFAETVLHKTFAELRKAGFDPKTAFETAANLSEKQARYHMLDFANRLQVEQDLRWVSYFATKHRLYWKWVIGTLVRRPGLAAAVTDFRNNLDPSGNIPFEIHGHKLDIPAARLMWVPGREYSEVSPLLTGILGVAKAGGNLDAGFNAAAGTYGNVITRSDAAIRLGVKLARISTGNLPATYGAATAGMSASDKQRTNRALNEYQLAFYAEHGHYAPEADAVKHVLLAATAEELWRANLPLPVLPNTDPSAEQDQVRKFMALTDPAKRRAFLAKHPGVSDHFGIYQDPAVYLHNREFFRRYTATLDTYRAARADLFRQAQQDGFTPAIGAAKRKLDKSYQAAFDAMLLEDAKTGGGKIQDGKVVTKGSWGRIAAADPQLDPRATLNALFPKLKDRESYKVFGLVQKQLQQELTLLNDPTYAATYPDPQELKTRKREILQQLEVFRNYPSDALGRAQLQYQVAHADPYWKSVDSRYQAIQKLPSAKQDAAYAKFRAWRDTQDNPVTIDGVKFPSPIRMAWATLDPGTKRQRLAKLAAANWDHLTNYEKTLLGAKPTSNASRGWLLLTQFYDAEEAKLPTGDKLPPGYRLTLAKYVNRYYEPGFLKDFYFANEPAWQRLKTLSVVTDSPHAQQWSELLGAAQKYAKAYVGNRDFTRAAVLGTWRNYVDSSVAPWIAETPGFKRELDSFGPDFLYGLVTP